MRPEQALAPAATDAAPYELLEVASLNSEDGTVNLWWGDQLIVGVPADTSYTNRRAGDVVRVDKGPLSWRVRGPVGPAADPGSVSWGSVLDKPDLAGVTYGEAAAPAGYQAATQVYVSGNKVYVQVPTGGGSGGNAGGSVPDSTGVTPTDRVVYQGGHRTSAINGGHPVQGSYGYLPTNMGAWFYGSLIAAAASKGNVASIDIWLARTSNGGRSGAVRPHLYLLTEGSPPYATPSRGALYTPDLGLTWNDDHHYTLPANFVTALASGSAKGIGAYAPTGTDYIRFRTCGGLTITYS